MSQSQIDPKFSGGILFENDREVLLDAIGEAIGNYNLFARDRPFRAIEIGIDDCRTSLMLMETARILAKKVYGAPEYIGIDPSCPAEEKINKLKEVGNFKFFNCPSKMFSHPKEDVIDFVFIDGCHCYECTVNDGIKFSGYLMMGGIIAFHDACEKTQGLDPQDYHWNIDIHDAEEARKGIAVRRAVEYFNEAFNSTMRRKLNTSLDFQSRGGIVAFQRVA